MDGKKKDHDIGKTFAVMAEICKVPAVTFAFESLVRFSQCRQMLAERNHLAHRSDPLTMPMESDVYSDPDWYPDQRAESDDACHDPREIPVQLRERVPVHVITS